MADEVHPSNQDRRTGGVRIGDVFGGIHDSIIAGGDVIQNIFLGGKKESRDRQNQLILLRRVRDFWIQGVLELSAHGAALIELGKEELARAVERPWDMVLQEPDRPSSLLPAGKPIVQFFEEVGGALLILGEPGSGKTVTLLELARDTIALAEVDPARPIPVVLHLSSWAQRRRPLAEWLVEELNAKYRIPRRIGRSWVEQDVLLLLLDGLDEVDADHRQACVEAINEYCEEHALGGIAVCSRTAEYDALGTKLNLGSAVLLQPLTPKQVNEYLVAAGPRFDALRMAMQQDASLQELAQTPLMLSVMTLTYQDTPAEALIPSQSYTPQASRQQLFAAYVERMFTRLVRATRESYGRGQSVTWLAWLARRMGDHSQSVFLLEGLQPSWLGTQAQRWLYTVGSRAIQGLLIGLVMVPLLFGLMQFYGLPSAGILIVCYLAAGIGVGLVDGLRFARGSPGQASLMSRKQRIWWFASNIALVGLSATLAWALVFYPAAASFSDAGFLQDFIRPIGPSLWKPSSVFVYVGLPFVLLWGLRGRRQSTDADIQTVESLSWSWQGFLIPLLVLGLIPAVITFAIASSASEPGARLWDGRDGALVASLKGHTGAKVVDPSIEVIPTVYDASFSRDGRRLVTVGLDGTVRLWDGRDGTPIAVLEGPRILINSWLGSRMYSCILSASFSPDGTRIATAGTGLSVWLWDAQDGALIASQEAHDTSLPVWAHLCTYSVRFSQDGTYIVTASGDDSTWLWDGQDGMPIGILEKDTHQVELANSSPDGTHIWTVEEDGAFRLRDRRQEDVPLAVLEGDTDRVVSAKLSPDETRILTISDDGTARLLGRWNGKPIAILEHELDVDSASFSPDGTRIVTTGPNTDDERPLSVLWLVPGVLLGLAGGLRGVVRETKTSPNEGIRLSARNASVVALALGLTSVGLLIAFIVGRAMPDAYDLWAYYEGFESTTAVLVATVFGFVAVLSLLAYGGLDVLHHYLLRLILVANGRTPWRYARFLDYAAERILLRKVGGGYIFTHRLLMDYFASQTLKGASE